MKRSHGMWQRLRGLAVVGRSGGERPGALHGVGEKHREPANPWLSMHSQTRTDTNLQAAAVSEYRPSPDGNRKMPPLTTQEVAQAGAPRWLSEASSPYGFSDEDGTMRQTETGTWRRSYSGGRFTPTTRDRSGGGQGGRNGAIPPKSTWFLQAVAAAVLVVAGVYAVHNQSSFASDVRGVYHSAFAKDDSAVVWSKTNQFLTAHHVHLPGFTSTFGAIHLHTPLNGQITQDYGPDQPEMTITGTPGEHVFAAGSGTVTRVTSTKDGAFIEIDHGAIGTSWYSGVAHPTVHVNEYVVAGQVIGSLPTTSAHPALQFALEKDNHFENPHDYIHFASQTQS